MSVFDLAVLGRGAETHAAEGALRLIAAHRRPAIVVSDGAGPGPLAGAARDQVGTSALVFARWVRGALGLPGAGSRSSARSARCWSAAAHRVTLTAGAVVVLALATPRDEVTDLLLAESADVVVLAEPGGAVASLALWQLDELGVVARALSSEQHVGTLLARFGWAAPAWATRSPRGTS